MNKKLKELAAQANFGGIDKKTGELIFDERLEKYGELIVQRCISLVALIGVSNWENDDITFAVTNAVNSIKEDFGV